MAQTVTSIETFTAALKFCNGLEQVELQGESQPLLHLQVIDLSRMIEAKGTKMSIIANGSLLICRRVVELADLPAERVCVSIESPDGTRLFEIRGSLPNLKMGLLRLRKAQETNLETLMTGTIR